ncbi:MAG: cyclohexanecarboxyl-CoA dehydrogenase [bacterium]
MDFHLTPDQERIRDAARTFAERRLAPDYQKREKEDTIDRGLLREMGELGLIAPVVPEEFGGVGLDCVTMGLVVEEIARGDFNISYVQLLGALNGQILTRHASPELADEWLPKICRGEVLTALALTEPTVGSDAAHLQLRARRDGDDFIFNGEKTSISFAHQADAAITFARTGEGDGAHGISAFMVPLDLPGIHRTRFDDVGTLVVGRGSIFFEDVRVPAAYRLGDEGRGFTQVMQGFDFSRALIGLECVGAAAASLEETWAFVTERKAFGSPIASYEGVTFPLAEGETMLEAARLLCYKTLWLKDNNLPHTAEAAMAKWFCPKTAFDIIHNCLLLHGHGGYGKETPHQQRLRDVMGLEIGDGTAQIMKLIIARERVGRVAVPY